MTLAVTPVPDLSNMTEANARAEIEKVGHVVGEVEKPYDERVEAGTASSAQAAASGASARPMAELAWRFAERA